MGRAKKQLAVVLSFQTIICKCGGERIRGTRCPDCRRQPERHEVDYHSLRRKKSLSELQALHLAASARGVLPIEVSDTVSEHLSSLAKRIPPAFKTAIMDDELGPLRDLIDDIAATAATIEGWHRVRPYVVRRNLAAETTDHIHSAVTFFLEACTANTIIEAQGSGARMQEALDRAADTGSLLVAAEQPDDDLNLTSMETFIASLIEVELARIGLSLRQVIEGDPALNTLLGIVPAEELRLSAVLIVGAAEGLDRDEFVSTFTRALDYFRGCRPALEQLADETAFRSALLDADVVVANAVWQAQSALQKAQSDQQYLNAASTLMCDLVEGPGALIARAALRLAGIKSQPYEKLEEDNATSQIDRIAGVPDLGFLVAGVDTDLRVARSHNQLKMVEGRVVAVRRQRSRSYSKTELVDTVLHGVETVAAVSLAMRQALSEIGTHLADPDLEAIGLDECGLARIAIHELYEGDIELALDSETLRIRIDGAPDLNALALVAATGPFLKRAKRFEVTQRLQTGVKTLAGRTETMKKPLPADEIDRQLHTLRCMADCTVDGEAAVGETEARKLIVGIALPVLLKEKLDLDDGKRLRRLIDYARTSRDRDLEAVLRKCMLRMTDQPIPNEVIDQVAAWAKEPTHWKL